MVGSNGWLECGLPPVPKAHAFMPGTKAYYKYLGPAPLDVGTVWQLNAIVGREPDLKGTMWNHISLSCMNSDHERRGVTREELFDARKSLIRGGVVNYLGDAVQGEDLLMADIFPPLDHWQPGDTTQYVAHLWEIPRELWD